MYFGKWISTGTSNDADNPLITKIKCSHGVLTEWNITFPKGSSGTHEVQVFDELHQVIPATEGEVVKGDYHVYQPKEWYPLVIEPFELQVHTANTDGANTRNVGVFFTVTPFSALEPMYKTNIKLESLLERLGV